jgi:transposase-like protein
LTGTPLARLRHKGRWLDYLGGMLDSHSIRRAASELGVAGATTFRWRHRFLELGKNDRPRAWTASPRPTRCMCSNRTRAHAGWNLN